MRSPTILLLCALPILTASLTACPSKDAVVDVKDPATVPSATTSATTQTPSNLPSGLEQEQESALDKNVSPCDDFFQFACGGWIKSTPIPDDEDRWVRSFNVIREKNEKLLHDMLESFARGEPAKANGKEYSAPETKMIGDFYASCMDEKGIEDGGISPLKKDLLAIDAIASKAALIKVIADLQSRGVNVVFGLGEQQDFGDATKVVGAIEQGGLGMPEREYYRKTDDKSVALRDKYAAHVNAMFGLLGEKAPNAKTDTAAVMKIETALAEASMTKEDRRDPKKVYHLMAAPDLKKEFPAFTWDSYEKQTGTSAVASFNIAQPDFLKVATQMTEGKTASFSEWKAYLKWHLVHSMAPTLPKAFVDENFKWQQALRGTPTLAPRWKRCVRATDAEVGYALAKAFVAVTLGEEGKSVVKDLIGHIEESMGHTLDSLAWMDGETRTLAHTKLGKISNKVAYPDKWRSYDGLQIERGKYTEDVMRADAFEMKREIAKIGKPVDRTEWDMTPPTVNAYYNPSMNEMVFPAGILQFPFFTTQQAMPFNFGGIGFVMGHELTHGFDDEGRQFDGDGNLKDWWSKGVGAEFDRRASCIEKQYGGYEVNGEHVNGKLTLGENIADNGGVKLAYYAMKDALAKKPEATQSSFSPEQRFFIGVGQSWCASTREAEARRRLATDPHSPPQFRVNGPLSNFPEFAKAFQCKEDSKMAKKDHCEVW